MLTNENGPSGPALYVAFHSDASTMTLISCTGRHRFHGELRRRLGAFLFCTGGDWSTIGGCLVAPQEIATVGITGILLFPQSSSSVKSMRSSSEMYELGPAVQPPVVEEDVLDDVAEGARTSRLGHDGYAQLADGLPSGKTGDEDEEKQVDVVVDGGERSDFSGTPMGWANASPAPGTEEVEDDGETERSLLLSSDSIWSGYMTHGDDRMGDMDRVWFARARVCEREREREMEKEESRNPRPSLSTHLVSILVARTKNVEKKRN